MFRNSSKRKASQKQEPQPHHHLIQEAGRIVLEMRERLLRILKDQISKMNKTKASN
jgi:hypothetical protein